MTYPSFIQYLSKIHNDLFRKIRQNDVFFKFTQKMALVNTKKAFQELQIEL